MLHEWLLLGVLVCCVPSCLKKSWGMFYNSMSLVSWNLHKPRKCNLSSRRVIISCLHMSNYVCTCVHVKCLFFVKSLQRWDLSPWAPLPSFFHLYCEVRISELESQEILTKPQLKIQKWHYLAWTVAKAIVTLFISTSVYFVLSISHILSTVRVCSHIGSVLMC